MLIMIDNYDSFTWNLVQYLGDLGEEARVIRNDKATVPEILSLSPGSIIISPGPGDPDHAGICLQLIKAAAEHKIPLLGVCLGHQAIGQAFGGKVIRAPQPMHGRLSRVSHVEKGLFSAIPSPYQVTRYHSLIVERDTLPGELTITAETEDGLIMGLSHKTLPVHGIQYHPESIETEHGHALLRNFLDMTRH
jgi:anthranilate synthase component 2